MALTWDVSAILEREGKEFVWRTGPEGDRSLNGRIECVIYLAMFVGIGTITDQNARRFFERVRAYENAGGPLCTNREKITAREVYRCRGLRTNASHQSDAEFRKTLWRVATRGADEEWKEAMLDAEA